MEVEEEVVEEVVEEEVGEVARDAEVVAAAE